MGSFDKNTIKTKILKAHKTQKEAFNKVENKVREAKTELLKEFNENPITQEIEKGPKLPHSEILPEGYGNLFSFFGFDENFEPIEPIRQQLESIHLDKKIEIEKNKYTFTIKTPSTEDLEEKAPLRWDTRSWISAVTYGIGRFSHYMFSLTLGRFKKSYSGTAVEVKPDLGETQSYLRGRAYVIGFLGKFKRKFQRN